MSTLALQYFDVTSTPADKIERAIKHHVEDEIRRLLRCKACGHIITTEEDRIKVNAQHVHTCTNPAGIKFTFGCFRTAPGVQCAGPGSFEYTWFAGHSWQIILCAGCGEHLGWLFRGAEEFFALILDRLIN